MVAGGIDVKLAQQRLGHHDPSLTLKVYAMTYREAEADAVRRMPDLTAPPTGKSTQATGTDGGDAAQRQAQRAANISVHHGSSSCARSDDDAGEDAEPNPLKSQEKCAEVRDDSSSFVNPPGRARTCNLRFRRPLPDNCRYLPNSILRPVRQ